MNFLLGMAHSLLISRQVARTGESLVFKHKLYFVDPKLNNKKVLQPPYSRRYRHNWLNSMNKSCFFFVCVFRM
jgi:hypothetical protein